MKWKMSNQLFLYVLKNKTDNKILLSYSWEEKTL